MALVGLDSGAILSPVSGDPQGVSSAALAAFYSALGGSRPAGVAAALPSRVFPAQYCVATTSTKNSIGPVLIAVAMVSTSTVSWFVYVLFLQPQKHARCKDRPRSATGQILSTGVLGEPSAKLATAYVQGNTAFDAVSKKMIGGDIFMGEFGITVVRLFSPGDRTVVEAFRVWLYDRHSGVMMVLILATSRACKDAVVRREMEQRGEVVEISMGRTVQLRRQYLQSVCTVSHVLLGQVHLPASLIERAGFDMAAWMIAV